MKAVQIDEYGDASSLVVNDVEVPAPGPGEVRVKLDVAGINFIDIYMREGHYRNSATYGTPLPVTLGMEGGGVIDALGEGVTNRKIGERVAWCLERGSYAQYATVPAWKLATLPDDIDTEVGTTLMLQGCTAHYLARSAFTLDANSTCLVHAAAGGVGRLLVQLAKRVGAKVIATVGSAEKAELVRALGADVAVQYRHEDFYPAVMDATDGQGVNVVYDSVGVDTIERSLKSLKRRGTCVNYGGSSGLVESVSVLALAEAGSVFFTRPHLAHYLADSAEIAWRTDELFAAVRAGDLDVNIDRRFALADVADAHDALEGRTTTGKLLLTCS